MSKVRTGIYPGTFDPLHNGHMDVIRRATTLVDRLVIACAINVGKEPLFPLEERVAMIRDELASLPENGTRIEVIPFETLLVHFAQAQGAQIVVRGLRAVSDFEFEFQMAANNKRLAPKLETVFLMASEHCQWISSRFIKEIHGLGGDVASFVSPQVLQRLDQRRGRG
ncbi:pantetheine-phosphate adenylyltransferase [Geminicoccus flavidas]|uniref:pantetheine-phosphate adenylyltransferase n=1 Tax=Geminicoccus flavidas TaxID=2506407 RepID=UPI001357E519|nr:pantetheine-phosphate adenylyltransferase [Geminicoccus flavidas]